jgi:hypothetical protein
MASPSKSWTTTPTLTNGESHSLIKKALSE